MRRFLVLVVPMLLTTTVIADGACRRNPVMDLYNELGCLPRFENKEKCPTSYDCSSYEQRDKTKCYLDKRQYNAGDDIEGKFACTGGCSCRTNGDTPVVYMNCTNIECPEYSIRLKSGCYQAYEHGSCCAKATICNGKENKPKVTCKYRQTTYYEGQKFFPEEEPCKECICGEGYKGRLEAPFCKVAKCDAYMRSQKQITEGCAPVFLGPQGCCPFQWRCPEKGDKVRASRTITEERIRTSELCKFGDLVLKPGEALKNLKVSPVDCICELPPYLTCISRESLYGFFVNKDDEEEEVPN